MNFLFHLNWKRNLVNLRKWVIYIINLHLPAKRADFLFLNPCFTDKNVLYERLPVPSQLWTNTGISKRWLSNYKIFYFRDKKISRKNFSLWTFFLFTGKVSKWRKTFFRPYVPICVYSDNKNEINRRFGTSFGPLLRGYIPFSGSKNQKNLYWLF